MFIAAFLPHLSMQQRSAPRLCFLGKAPPVFGLPTGLVGGCLSSSPTGNCGGKANHVQIIVANTITCSYHTDIHWPVWRVSTGSVPVRCPQYCACRKFLDVFCIADGEGVITLVVACHNQALSAVNWILEILRGPWPNRCGDRSIYPCRKCSSEIK